MPAINYFLGIPNQPDNPSNDQPNMKLNTNAVDTWNQVNHYTFASPNAGRHLQVEMPVLASRPSNQQTGQGTLYTKTATTASGNKESSLYYNPDNTINEYQLTRTIASKGPLFSTYTIYQTSPITLSGGWTFLPGGMLFQYGFISNPITSSVIVYPVPFSTFAIVNLTPVSTSIGLATINLNAVTTMQFTIYVTPQSSLFTGLYWTAIGV